MADRFANLHVHIDTGSILDGFGTSKEYIDAAVEIGQEFIAGTDHGTMGSAYDLHVAAQAAGMKAVTGIEAYVTPGDTPMDLKEPVFFSSGSAENREERSNDVSGGGAYTHMTMFAETDEGKANLFTLSTEAWQQGYYRKPRMSVERISQCAKGVIATTGCPSGELQTRLRLGQWKEAIDYAAKMQDIFGKENYFLELMDHNMSIGLERDVREGLLKVSKQLAIPHLITNDAHYATQSQAPSHEHMLCVQSGSSMNEPTYENGGKRFAFEGHEYYLKSRDEMEMLFDPIEFKEGLDNTLLVAERCNTTYDENPNLRVKSLDLEPGLTEVEQLRKNVREGLARRLPDKATLPEYVERCDYEIDIIVEKGFPGYMLVVSDFMRHAKFELDMVCGPARGSGGGSLVAFALDITDMDPIEHGLLFERFLNPERPSAPDIDSDFPDDRREEVIDYVRQKYGNEYVSMITTFGKIKAKNAIKDVARIFDEPYTTGDLLTKALPPDKQGRSITLSEVVDSSHARYTEGEKFREMIQEPGNKKIFEAARRMEGRVRSTGVHAAGVIMSSRPLVETIPLQMRQSDKTMITGWDYPTCESLGLIKMDFLGLRNLTVLQRARDAIMRNHGVEYNLQEIYDNAMTDPDPVTYKMLAEGKTLGVFQLDGTAMTAFVKQMKPTLFTDISAALALFRPGPMGMESHIKYASRKNGLEEIEPIHPELHEPLDEILAETYHLIVYQEQVMAIAQKVAGYSLGSADNLRRIMGKKKASALAAEKPGFVEGMQKNGYGPEAIETLWETLIPFSEYGFNKSHSVGYALISLATAKMKAHYPAEFMAANLSTITDDSTKTALYLEECRHLGIEVHQPSVSRSGVNYTSTPDRKIHVGLSAVRGIGVGPATLIADEAANGEFRNLEDFLNRVPQGVLAKGVLEGLAHSGGLDGLGYSRRALFNHLPEVAKGFADTKKKEAKGAVSLFEELSPEDLNFKLEIPDEPEYTKRDKLAFERHMLGLYVSDHPLSSIADALDGYADISIARVLFGDRPQVGDAGGGGGFGGRGPKFTLAGIVNSLERRTSKAGKPFASFSVEDMSGSIRAMMFSRALDAFGSELHADGVYRLRGSILNEDDEDKTFAVDAIEEIVLTDDGRIPFDIALKHNQVNDDSMADLGRVLQKYPGGTPVYLHVKTPQGGVDKYALASRFDINPDRNQLQSLRQEIRMLFGIRSV